MDEENPVDPPVDDGTGDGTGDGTDTVDSSIWDAIIEFINDFFLTLWELLIELFLAIVEIVLDAVVAIIDSIPVPDFLADGLTGLVADFPPILLYAIEMTGIPECLAILGTAFAFRMLRKVFTLFQW